jgi:hypothetical protein
MYENGLTFNVVVVVGVLRPKTDIGRSHRTVVADDIHAASGLGRSAKPLFCVLVGKMLRNVAPTQIANRTSQTLQQAGTTIATKVSAGKLQRN